LGFSSCSLLSISSARPIFSPRFIFCSSMTRTERSSVLGKIDLRLWEERESDPEALRREFQSVKGAGWLKRWLPARAHDNGMFVLFSNGVGRDDDEVRTGNAMIIDCFGEVLAESKEICDDLIISDLDTGLLSHATGRNWIKGRRPELYGEITKERSGRMDVRTLKAIE